jgi:hypothetical protein
MFRITPVIPRLDGGNQEPGAAHKSRKPDAVPGCMVRRSAGFRRGMAWLGPFALVPVPGVHPALKEDRRGELRLILAAAVIGFLSIP